MNQELSSLAAEIMKVAYLRGEFLLRSGKTSNEYFDKYRFESRPDLLRRIAKGMRDLLPTHFDYLAGLEMGGIPIATALSLETGKPCLFIRKEAKKYGTCQFAEGADVAEVKGKTLLVIEDVITTGGQVLLSTEDLRRSGAVVKDVLSVIYRGEALRDEKHGFEGDARLNEIGVRHQTLFTMAELKKAASQS